MQSPGLDPQSLIMGKFLVIRALCKMKVNKRWEDTFVNYPIGLRIM